jgi:hypothetical protein
MPKAVKRVCLIRLRRRLLTQTTAPTSTPQVAIPRTLGYPRFDSPSFFTLLLTTLFLLFIWPEPNDLIVCKRNSTGRSSQLSLSTSLSVNTETVRLHHQLNPLATTSMVSVYPKLMVRPSPRFMPGVSPLF